jgi:hypothetical protein
METVFVFVDLPQSSHLLLPHAAREQSITKTRIVEMNRFMLLPPKIISSNV